MKFLQPLVLGATLAAFGSAAANAASETSEYVDSISWETGIGGPQILVTNKSNSKLADQVSLGLGQNSIDIPVKATVRCEKDKDVNAYDAMAYFGPVDLSGLDDIMANATLHSAPINVTFYEWEGNFNGGWLAESTPDDTYTVPLGSITSGHPTVRVDAVAEMEAELQKHLQGGGTRGDFFRNDQDVLISRPVSIAGACKEGNDIKWGYVTKMINIFIHYEGDPSIIDKPKLNAQLQGNMANQINQNLPFKLETADFMANVPHHIAACPPAIDPSLRVTINGSGGVPGNVGVRIYEDGAGLIHEATVQLNPQNAGAPIDFDYPLKARLLNNQAWNVVNKTFEHKLRVRARYQDSQGQWTSWSEYDSAVFKHRCTPKLNVNLGNTNGGLGGYQQQGGDNPIVPQMEVAPQQLPEPPSGGAATKVAPRQTPPPPSAGAATQIAPATLDPTPTTPTLIQRAPVEPVEKPKRATN